MEFCSDQCLHRTFYAVLIGMSPIILCLFLIAIGRVFLHCLELFFTRGQIPIDRRRSSSLIYQSGRPTLSYTPVSLSELQRIIHGKYDNQQASESSSSSFFHHEHDSPKASHFMKSILNRNESPTPVSTNTLASLVIRRNAINSTPLTALLAPTSTSTSPTLDVINERTTRRPSLMRIKHESVETTTLSSMNNNNNNNQNIFYNTNDSCEPELTETDPLVPLPKTMTTTTTTTTVVVEEFHSVRSVPYSLNLANSNTDEEY